MADYYIKCTEKNSDGDILAVGYSYGLSAGIGGKRKDKDDVIDDIDNRNKDVMTAIKKAGSWTEGEDVHTVEGEYIRTDRNQTESDNLDNIPPC